jgi:DNA-binding Lrp family transcriptional regulator
LDRTSIETGLNLDSADLSILKVLTKDGRASLREIAARTSLSTPTVSLHLSRMRKGGLIKGFVPVIDPSAIHEVAGFIRLKVPAQNIDRVAMSLARMEEVTGVFITTGEENLVVRVSSEDVEGLQRFVGSKLARHLEGELVSDDVVTRTLKDERSTRLKESATIRLRCDFCGQEITSSRPYNIQVGSTYHYFCCRTCRKSYLEKHRSRIKLAASRAGQTNLHS